MIDIMEIEEFNDSRPLEQSEHDWTVYIDDMVNDFFNDNSKKSKNKDEDKEK